jgi:hypothetical protein
MYSILLDHTISPVAAALFYHLPSCCVSSSLVESSLHTRTHTHIHPPSHPHPLFKVLLRLVPCACPCPDLLHLPSLHTAHHTTTSYRHLTSPPQPPTNIPGKRQCPRSLASIKARPACPLPARQSIDRSLFTPSCVPKTPCVSLSRAVQSCSAAT